MLEASRSLDAAGGRDRLRQEDVPLPKLGQRRREEGAEEMAKVPRRARQRSPLHPILRGPQPPDVDPRPPDALKSALIPLVAPLDVQHRYQGTQVKVEDGDEVIFKVK